MPATPLDLFADLNRGAADRRVAAEGRFFGESAEVVRRLLSCGIRLEHLLVSDRRSSFAHELATDAGVTVLSEPELFGLVGFEMHRGVIGLFDRPEGVPADDLAGGWVLALESINDSNNLGSLIRTGAGLGIGGVLLDPTTADPFSRRSVRVSMGAVGSVPVARASEWPSALGRAQVVALAPRGEHRLEDVLSSSPGAVVVGSEALGLSEAVLDRADYRCAIPMSNGIDSLNVTQAAAIALYQLIDGCRTIGRGQAS